MKVFIFIGNMSNSNKVKRAIQQCDDMRPVISTRDDNLKTIQQLRIDMNSDSNVNSPINSSRSLRSTGRDDRKKLEDFMSDISSDLVGIQKKFDSLMNCVSGILNRLENIESRLATLENKETNQPSYSHAIQNGIPNESVSLPRIERLEFLSSEDERKNRLLQLTLTHPDIDNSHDSLNDHIKDFLCRTMKMNQREIDANLYAQKSPRLNTVLIKFSDRRFKIFLYSARKRLRNGEGDSLRNLYINEYLTSYNYDILKKLKQEKKRLEENGSPSFASVYSFEGRVFVKRNLDDATNQAIHVRNPTVMKEFISSINPVLVS